MIFDVFREGVSDLRQGVQNTEFWSYLSHHEVKQRYRRSLIGPFWITITTGVMVVGVGILYGGLFGSNLTDYLPYLSVSLILWNYMAQSINDSCSLFVDSSGVMRQMKTPRSTFYFKVMYRNLIYLAHNVLIVVLTFLFFQKNPGLVGLWFIPFFLLFVANIGWMSLMASILCARFRDITPIVGSAIQLLFFMTPVMWQPSLLPNRLSFMTFNPFYHLMEIVREPLLGVMPSMLSICVTLALAIVGWLVALLLFSRTRRRIVFWV